MLCIKPFEESDAQFLCSLLSDREIFELTCAEKYGEFPLCPADILAYYQNPAALPFTPFYENKAAGHILIEKRENSAHLGSVIIKPELQGLGLGKETFSFAVSKARELGADFVTIGVFEENSRALSLYLSQGFEIFEKSARVLNGQSKPYLLLRKDF